MIFLKPIKNIKIGMNFSYEPSMPLSEDLNELICEYERMTEGYQQIKHIYAVAGLALYEAQCFEMGLRQAIICVEKYINSNIKTPEAYDLYDEKLSKLTLGKLLCEIRKFVEVEENTDEVLSKALGKRNYLTHHFFKDHALDFVNDNGRKQMLMELLESINIFRLANASIDCIARLFLKAMGIAEVDIDHIVQEYTRLRTQENG